ncbi:uncharacterized protein [Miscanthus floridulus]|uniref:uncharacterized protein n=1 Tax=Miscanthus floridulus TaxID=154761 RepID=UPI003457F696
MELMAAIVCGWIERLVGSGGDVADIAALLGAMDYVGLRPGFGETELAVEFVRDVLRRGGDRTRCRVRLEKAPTTPLSPDARSAELRQSNNCPRERQHGKLAAASTRNRALRVAPRKGRNESRTDRRLTSVSVTATATATPSPSVSLARPTFRKKTHDSDASCVIVLRVRRRKKPSEHLGRVLGEHAGFPLALEQSADPAYRFSLVALQDKRRDAGSAKPCMVDGIGAGVERGNQQYRSRRNMSSPQFASPSSSSPSVAAYAPCLLPPSSRSDQVYGSEKTRVDQVSEKVHPPVVLVPCLTNWISLWNLTFSATQVLTCASS